MNPLNVRSLAFATKTAGAAIIAILLALWFDLPSPGWAGLTVFITSQQMGGAAGAVVSRAVYRGLGTLGGAVGILFIIPAFNGPTELLILAIAAWVGVFLYLSLLIRGPQAYTLLLAGYTLPLVGMGLANNPQVVFDFSQWRVEEIGLGATVSVCIHSVFAPRSVRPVFIDKMHATMSDARRWILQGLGPEAIDDTDRWNRGRLGADLVEMGNTALHLSYEPGVTRQDIAAMARLEARLLKLLPLLAGVESRLPAIRVADTDLAARVDAQLETIRRQLTQPLDRIGAAHLSESCRTLVDTERANLTDAEVLVIGAMERLAELLDEWNECLTLSSCLAENRPAADPRDGTAPSPRALHVDRALAAHSSVATMLAVAIAGALCWVLGWEQGAPAIGFAAMTSALFAFLDDPRPVLRLAISLLALAVPLAALYVFAILPAVDGAAWLALVLAPPFFLCALFMTTPKLGMPAFICISMFLTAISLQPVQASDFTSFTALVVAMTLGAIIALVVTSLVRVISVETSVRRLLRAAWLELASMATGVHEASRVVWASRMIDRIGLLLPRLAGTSVPLRMHAERALDDLRMGVNILDLRSAALAAGADVRAAAERTLAQIGAHFRQRLERPDVAPETAMLASIDDTIAELIRAQPNAARVQGLTAATGLRLGLFPSATVNQTLKGVAP